MIPGQNPTADRNSTENAPQNGYRSYDPESVFLDEKSWSNDRVNHERLDHVAVIKRANGGGPSDTSVVGHYVSDGKGATP